MIIASVRVVTLESFLKVKFQSGLSLLAGLSLPPYNFVVLPSDGTPEPSFGMMRGEEIFLKMLAFRIRRLFVCMWSRSTRMLSRKRAELERCQLFLQEPCVEIVPEN